jgi:hypothetical protein
MKPAGLGLIQGLSDNPLTRGWADLVAHRLVTPLERLTMDDFQLRQSLAKHGASFLSDELQVTPELEDRLRLAAQTAGYRPEDADAVVAGIGGLTFENAQSGRSEVAGMIDQMLRGSDRQRLVGIESRMMNEEENHTDVGTMASALLGNPVAAYGAVGGGGVLGTLALMDIAQRIQAYQAQREQEAPKAKKAPASQEAGA